MYSHDRDTDVGLDSTAPGVHALRPPQLCHRDRSLRDAIVQLQPGRCREGKPGCTMIIGSLVAVMGFANEAAVGRDHCGFGRPVRDHCHAEQGLLRMSENDNYRMLHS